MTEALEEHYMYKYISTLKKNIYGLVQADDLWFE